MTGAEEHREVDLLLPWYVSGTLEAENRRRVERHLAGCLGCRGEVEMLVQLRSAVVQAGAEVPAPSPGGLARVLATIDAEERPSLWDRLRAWLTPPAAAPRWALALAALVIVVQLGAIMALLGRESTGGYRTLSGQPGPGAAPARVTVVFQDGAPAAAVRDLLRGVGGDIVAGPTAQGVYTVEIRQPLPSPEALDRLLEALRTRREIVKAAERLE